MHKRIGLGRVSLRGTTIRVVWDCDIFGRPLARRVESWSYPTREMAQDKFDEIVDRMGGQPIEREWCPYCDEPVYHAAPDGIEMCRDHGVLEGLSDEEWTEILRDRESAEQRQAIGVAAGFRARGGTDKDTDEFYTDEWDEPHMGGGPLTDEQYLPEEDA